jgi:hypothetical protein
MRDWSLPLALGVITVAGIWAVYDASTRRDLSPVENVLLQVLILIAGVVASFLVGRLQGRAAGRSQARSAFNRAVTIQLGIVDMLEAIEGRREFLTAPGSKPVQSVSSREVEGALDLLSAISRAQQREAADAIKDWGEIVPDELARLTPASTAEAGTA